MGWRTLPFGLTTANHELMSCNNDNFLLMFNSTFHLPQGSSWTMFCLSNKLSTLVISELCNGPLNLGSWLPITKSSGSIGSFRPNLLQTVEWTQSSKTWKKRSRLMPSLTLLNGSGQARPLQSGKLSVSSDHSSHTLCHQCDVQTGWTPKPHLPK